MNAQTITSAATSRPQIPAVIRLGDRQDFWRDGVKVLDYGCGKYDHGLDALRERGVWAMGMDPYNRSYWENFDARVWANSSCPDYVLLSNVLNVIKESSARTRVLQDCRGLGQVTLITVYEGDRTGEGRETSCGWQEHRKLSAYLSEVQKVFPGAYTRGGMIVAPRSPEVGCQLNSNNN